ncbi:MAG: YybH family protein [Novosphingobium meiothermophilum]|uniref:YybH family protein n=1 Tax=Novosphingobium TaxID=165696 RepID=UPI000D6E1D01|nr:MULTISPECIES: nuclear transport factor 2 family protein [Novosphingobium]
MSLAHDSGALGAELAIRMRRAEFNRALAEGDLAAIAGLLAPEVILITGTDSAVIAGRKAQLSAWKREFSARPRTHYTRTPQTVIVSTVEPIAMEHGHWQGVIEGTGAAVASGTYWAKWRERPGDGWVLIAEIFLTLA